MGRAGCAILRADCGDATTGASISFPEGDGGSGGDFLAFLSEGGVDILLAAAAGEGVVAFGEDAVIRLGMLG